VNILVTGGAGYVGSICVSELLAHHHHVVVVDNLATGHRCAIPEEAVFVHADIAQSAIIDEILARHHIDAVMHFAGETLVTASMSDPRRYFDTNLRKSILFLDTVTKRGINNIIFSSTAAVYGEPQFTPITEDHPTHPINAYGESKLMFEKILAWYHRAYGLRYIAVRYFNAAGASTSLGEHHTPETHLIPLLLKAAITGSKVELYGNNYETCDGTCVRDYIHVLDIARAHILSLHALKAGRSGIYNVGAGAGFSVHQVIHSVESITHRQLRISTAPRRPGDPAILVASSARLQAELNWTPQHSELDTIVRSAWLWAQQHPNGYLYENVRENRPTSLSHQPESVVSPLEKANITLPSSI
jgi:UDP-glucose 4-epimerase